MLFAYRPGDFASFAGAAHSRRRLLSTLLVVVVAAAWLVRLQAAGTWASETSLPTPTQEVSVTALNGLAYVIAGSVNQVRTNAAWSYNPTTHAWSSLAPYPGTALDHAGIAALPGAIYLVGGLSAWPQPSSNSVQRYDVSANTWTSVAPLPIPRGAMGVTVLNGKIYAAGGLENGASVADFTVYDPSANTWTSLPNMPTARDHLVAAALNGKIYAIGGRNNSNVCAPYKTVEVYDPASNTWSTGTPMLNAHAGAALGMANGHMQVFGGEGNPVNCGIVGAAEDFDPTANAWTALPDMPTPRHGTGGATINNSVFIPAGATAPGDAATAVHQRFDALAATLPSGWADQDVGSVGLAGSASFYNGTFTVSGEGSDIWGTADSFHFTDQPLNGDGQVVARVVSVQNTNAFAKAGVMLRETANANSASVILDVKPGGGVEFMARASTGASTTYLAGNSAAAPVWLKLVRAGSTITASSSPDGSTWTTVGTTTVSMATTIDAGLAVTSHSSGYLNTSTFDNVAVAAASSGSDTPPVVSITSPTSGATFTAPASIAIAANASDPDGTAVAKVDFYANNALLGTATTSPFTYNWTNVQAGSYSLTAIATDSAGLQTTSTAVSITVSSGGGGGGGGALPSPWVDQDVGNVGLAGSATYSAPTFTLKGAGADIWGTADSFNFAYQPLSGNGQIVARVVSLQNTSAYAKAGVMIRETTSAGSTNVLLDVKPGGGLEFMSRSATGASTTFLAGGSGSAPIWLKLTRSGTTFTAYSSPDGTTWTTIGTTSVTMATSVAIGLVVCSHNTSQLNTATFDNVAVTVPTTTDQPPTVSITSPASGASFTAPATVSITAAATDTDSTPVARVDFYANNNLLGTATTSPYTFSWTNVAAGSYSLTAIATDTAGLQATSAAVSITVSASTGGGGGALPSPWVDQDVGAVGLAGSATYSAGTFTVNGAGADIWGTADSFNYVDQPLSGDGQVVARVVSLQNTSAYAKAGVMIRATTSAGASDVVLDVKPGGGVEFMSRPSTGASTSFIAGGTGSAPLWLKIVRSGSTVTGYSSPDGNTWTTVGTTSVTMATSVTIGLVVCSHNTSQLNTATFDNVAVTAGGGGGGGGGGTLPSPWVDQDIGSVGLAGSATYSNGTFTVSGAGADVWGTSDSFNFVYQPLTGSGQVTARVTAIQNTGTFAKAGVMIRESLGATARNVLLDLNPNGGGAAGGGMELLARTTAGGSTVYVQGVVAITPAWVKLVRSGDTITAYTSTDGNGWSPVNTVTLTSLSTTVYVGLVVCSHNTSLLNTSTFDNVSVATTATVSGALTFTKKVLAAATASGTAVGIPNLYGPTSLALGPDGKLYVSGVNGRIFVLTLDQTKLMQAGQAAVTNVQEFDDIYLKPSLTCNINNQPFNCQQLSSTGSGRQVTGIAIDPKSTASNIILYVSNSNFSTTTTSMAIDTYSGTITRLILQPDPSNAANQVVASNQDLVVGLPRSRESHSPNGLSIGPDGWLYLAEGGNTNAGQASSYFLNLPEYYLGASVLRLNLAALPGTLPIDMHNVSSASGMTAWQGIFEIYSTGYRNPYDLVWHSNGKLYINVNSPNQGQGLTPSSADGCSSTPSIDVGTPPDYLRLVTKGSYGGHPNPARGECVWGDGTVYSPAQPTPGNYLPFIGNYVRGWGDSSDGITEYTSNAFGGAMTGNLITATFDTDFNVRRVVLTPDGAHVNEIVEIAPFTEPLDVWVDRPGNIYVADYGANQIVLLIPGQPGT